MNGPFVVLQTCRSDGLSVDKDDTSEGEGDSQQVGGPKTMFFLHVRTAAVRRVAGGRSSDLDLGFGPCPLSSISISINSTTMKEHGSNFGPCILSCFGPLEVDKVFFFFSGTYIRLHVRNNNIIYSAKIK